MSFTLRWALVNDRSPSKLGKAELIPSFLRCRVKTSLTCIPYVSHLSSVINVLQAAQATVARPDAGSQDSLGSLKNTETLNTSTQTELFMLQKQGRGKRPSCNGALIDLVLCSGLLVQVEQSIHSHLIYVDVHFNGGAGDYPSVDAVCEMFRRCTGATGR